jgi:hypothetical protein
MFKRWMRCEPYQRPGGGWVPMAQLWEETPDGAVEQVRLVAKPDFTAATAQEATAHAGELLRRWRAGGPARERRDGARRRAAPAPRLECAGG